ncbi:MAG: diaminopimelate epimerase [Gammaproteobacteria bacterium]|nr:diaminopimelate epimerase [Gammaproteobacteria bacterium]
MNFTKMHGLGNDFMVIDNILGAITLSAEQIIALAHRHLGVGFDQLLMVESSTTPGVDFRYIIYNADGTEVEQCGNGARCFARFVTEKGLTTNNPINVETRAGLMSLFVNDNQTVQVDMGEPNFNPINIPLHAMQQQNTYEIAGFEVATLSIGNPHCVMLVNDVNTVNVQDIAIQIQQSELLPNQANVGFMQVLNANEINLRVYERGAGETLACGSGACAAVISGVRAGLLDSTVVAHLRGGDALIEYTENEHVFLSGPAQFVYEGQIEI